jgi:hypothetical protein
MSCFSIISHLIRHKGNVLITKHSLRFLNDDDMMFLYFLNAINKVEFQGEMEVNLRDLKNILGESELDMLLATLNEEGSRRGLASEVKLMSPIYQKWSGSTKGSGGSNPKPVAHDGGKIEAPKHHHNHSQTPSVDFETISNGESEHAVSRRVTSEDVRAVAGFPSTNFETKFDSLQVPSLVATSTRMNLEPPEPLSLAAISKSIKIDSVQLTSLALNDSLKLPQPPSLAVTSTKLEPMKVSKNLLTLLLSNQKNGFAINAERDKHIWQAILAEYSAYVTKNSLSSYQRRAF